VADELNNFFSSVFSDEGAGDVPAAADMNTRPLERIRITDWAIRKRIRKLKKDSAPGIDGIGPRLLQELEETVAVALGIIFRRSMERGEVPDDWRRANVTPIYKKGTKADPGNYRPVSLTSVCCKLMEGVIRDELMAHLEANNLIAKSQHGFLRGRSCTTNLLEALEFATREADAGRPVDMIYLDFAKAFDKVPRRRLLEKLRAHGVGGTVLQWIGAWLTGREQRVVLNGTESEWAAVRSGVPQGSVLGPILFLIYINDLDAAAGPVDLLKKFADDTKVGQGVDTAEKREELQTALDNLCAWADRWHMQFNVKKCKVLHIGGSNSKHQYSMNGQRLEAVTEETDIGVLVSSTLKPSAQCAKAARTAQAVLGQLTRAFHYRDKRTFMRLFTTYVRPHLEFAVPAWSPWTQADIDCLERVQKRAVAMVSGLTGRTYEERLAELEMVTLKERRHQLDMLETYKIVTGKEGLQKETWFEMAGATGRATRATADPLNLRVPAPRLEIRRHFFSQRVPKSWNEVPSDLKNVATVEAFRHGYRRLRRQRGPNGGE